MVSEAHIKANIKYNKKMDNIMIRPSKEVGQQIRDAAKEAGQPVQRFILDIVTDAIGIKKGG